MACIAACVGKHDIEMMLTQAIFQQGYSMSIENIGYVCADNADDFHRIEA